MGNVKKLVPVILAVLVLVMSMGTIAFAYPSYDNTSVSVNGITIPANSVPTIAMEPSTPLHIVITTNNDEGFYMNVKSYLIQGDDALSYRLLSTNSAYTDFTMESTNAPGNYLLRVGLEFTDPVTYNRTTIWFQANCIIGGELPSYTTEFLQPINADGSSIFKGGVIPIRAIVRDNSGNIVENANLTLSYKKISSPVGTVTEAISICAADTGNVLRYNSGAGEYMYNLDARSLEDGHYELTILNNGVSIGSIRFTKN